ncbi:MAG TPA: hypothetical protein VFT50_10405 [Baekduia sp.]|nr:hypothetical protein [Baekduia sp.]
MPRAANRRLAPLLAVALAAVAVGLAALLPSSSPAPPPLPATGPTVWVDHDGGTCQRTTGPYRDATACSTLDTAYEAARPDDRVLIRGGTYPSQRIGVDPTKVGDARRVVLEPAPGDVVRIAGDLTVAGSHLVVSGGGGRSRLHLRYAISEATDPAQSSSRDVTFENLDGAGFVIGPTERITVRGGDWGPNVLRCGDAAGQESKITPLDTFPGRLPRDIVLDGLRIHDQNSADLSCQHTGGLSVVSADGLTIRNTRWSQSAVYDLAVGDFTGRYGNPRDVLLENNWFGAAVLQDGRTPDGQPELQLAEPGVYERWTVRFNSFVVGPALNFDGGATFSGGQVVANIGGRSGCGAARDGVTWAANLWRAERCTGADRLVRSLPYEATRVGAEDLHLRDRRPASVHLPAGAGRPGRDIDGDARPARGPVDAGADQR